MFTAWSGGQVVWRTLREPRQGKSEEESERGGAARREEQSEGRARSKERGEGAGRSKEGGARRGRRAEAREERGRTRERGARSKEAKREQRGAIWTRKTRAFTSATLVKQWFGCVFRLKMQPNCCFGGLEALKARVLRVQGHRKEPHNDPKRAPTLLPGGLPERSKQFGPLFSQKVAKTE